MNMEPEEHHTEAAPARPGTDFSVFTGGGSTAEASNPSLPDCLVPLFHNYETSTIVPPRDATFFILTVLAHGEWRQIQALFALYKEQRIKAVVRADLDGLHPLPDVVANFWSVVFWGQPLRPRTLLERWSLTRNVPCLSAAMSSQGCRRAIGGGKVVKGDKEGIAFGRPEGGLSDSRASARRPADAGGDYGA